MSNWTLVEATLSDGLPMRLFIGERDGMVAAATLCDDQHPKTEDEFLWRFGSPITSGNCPRVEGSRAAGRRVLSRHTNQFRFAASAEGDGLSATSMERTEIHSVWQHTFVRRSSGTD